MENAADALKLAFAIFVFLLAFTVLFNTASLARITAETLVVESDETTYYTYIPGDDSIINREANGVITRIVTLDEIIPTIYRYSVESYGVTLIDKNGKIITRFDTDTETMCNIFDMPGTTIEEKQKLINEINNYVLGPAETLLSDNKHVEQINNVDDLRALFQRIYAQDTSRAQTAEYECPWIGNVREQWIAQRIDSDLFGKTTYFDIDKLGINSTNLQAKNHIPCLGKDKGIIGTYETNSKSTKFKECIVTHDKTNPTRGEEGDLFYIGENSRKSKRCSKKRNNLCRNTIVKKGGEAYGRFVNNCSSNNSCSNNNVHISNDGNVRKK